MSLCSIALERIIIEPSLEDLEIGSEGFIKETINKIVKFFKDIWIWIKEKWNKLLQFLGLKEKTIENKINEADKIVEETKKSITDFSKEDQKKLMEMHKAAAKIRNKYETNVNKILTPIEFADNFVKENFDSCPDIKEVTTTYTKVTDVFIELAKDIINKENEFNNTNYVKSIINYANNFEKIFSADKRNFYEFKPDTKSLNNYKNIDNTKSKFTAFFDIKKIKPNVSQYSDTWGIAGVYLDLYEIVDVKDSIKKLIDDSIEKRLFDKPIATYEDAIKYYTDIRDFIKSDTRRKEIINITSFARKSMNKAEQLTVPLINKLDNLSKKSTFNEETLLHYHDEFIGNLRLLGIVFKINGSNILKVINATDKNSKYIINIFDDVFEKVSKLYDELRAYKIKYRKDREEFDKFMKDPNSTLSFD